MVEAIAFSRQVLMNLVCSFDAHSAFRGAAEAFAGELFAGRGRISGRDSW
jgi:hypothetical protein